MKTEDRQLLADLRLKFHLGIEMNHYELAEMLRLQGQAYQEPGGSAPLQSAEMVEPPETADTYHF